MARFKLPRDKPTPEFLEAYTSSKTLLELAARVNLMPRTVREYLITYNLPLYNRKGATK